MIASPPVCGSESADSVTPSVSGTKMFLASALTGGGRFNSDQRGARYAGFDLETAHAEVIYHRTKEFREINIVDARVEMRLYLANFNNKFHDIRGNDPEFTKYHDPDSYADSQNLAQSLLAARSNGILYRSVRWPGGNCIACFRPRLVTNVRPSDHFEYRWEGSPVPRITHWTFSYDPGAV